MGTTTRQKTVKRVGGVRIIPLSFKIITIFTILLLLSNFVSNYINLMMNRRELVKLMNQLLIKDLKELYIYANNQYEIYQFTLDREKAVQNISISASREFRFTRSTAIGLNPDGTILFQSSGAEGFTTFDDQKALATMKANLDNGFWRGRSSSGRVTAATSASTSTMPTGTPS